MNDAKGYKKHELSDEHIKTFKIHAEKIARETKSKKIEWLLAKPTEDHIVWLETVFTVVKYLAVNGLPFCGHVENADFGSDNFGGGLYLNAYSDLVFKLRPDLLKIAQHLPSNAKYTGHEIQNEVIEILAEIVKNTVAERVRKSKLFTDKNGEEVIDLVMQFYHLRKCP